MCNFTGTTIYRYTSLSHRETMDFKSLEEAKNHANAMIAGYLDGTISANHPKPFIQKVQIETVWEYNW